MKIIEFTKICKDKNIDENTLDFARKLYELNESKYHSKLLYANFNYFINLSKNMCKYNSSKRNDIAGIILNSIVNDIDPVESFKNSGYYVTNDFDKGETIDNKDLLYISKLAVNHNFGFIDLSIGYEILDEFKNENKDIEYLEKEARKCKMFIKKCI